MHRSGLAAAAQPSLTVAGSAERHALVQRYRALRARSRAIFDLIDPDLYYVRPIAVRNPIVFYEGHLPGFALNTLIKKGLGRSGIDPRLERIFARGIDPESESTAQARHGDGWPTREEVAAFVAAADAAIEDALLHAAIDRRGVPVLDRAEGAYTILEHEAMHQETLLYMWHRIPLAAKRRPDGYEPRLDARPAARRELVDIPEGIVTLGADRDAVTFGWDNEFPAHRVRVAPFQIERHNVSNAAYREFVDAGAYVDPQWWRPEDRQWIEKAGIQHPLFWERHDDAWFWRGQFDLMPLPETWPVYVSFAEAAAFARWRGGRLMTEAEYHRAAFGTPQGDERTFPWGSTLDTRGVRLQPDMPAENADRHGTFDFASWDPVPVGSSPAGASAWGVEDLVGNGWEWTSSPFLPFEGFTAMPSYPEYSAEFFDGQHYVLKGASPVTARELLRPSLRNWFRPHYPFVYATFRCVF
jgi:ergothioneine biosynthesis protein EgtB